MAPVVGAFELLIYGPASGLLQQLHHHAQAHGTQIVVPDDSERETMQQHFRAAGKQSIELQRAVNPHTQTKALFYVAPIKEALLLDAERILEDLQLMCPFAKITWVQYIKDCSSAESRKVLDRIDQIVQNDNLFPAVRRCTYTRGVGPGLYTLRDET